MDEGSSPSGCASCGVESTPSQTSSSSSPSSSSSAAITLHIHPTTGGQFEVQLPHSATVDGLKKLVSKRLKVPKERICLLLKERHLREGSLQQNSVMDGCKITLLPNVETGLLAQRPEQSVMQALESLSDAQVSDFLSGKAPLNLTMRLGDHMMFIQLQLSTMAPSPARKSSGAPARPMAAAAAGEACSPLNPLSPLSAMQDSCAAAAAAASTSSSSSSSSTSSSVCRPVRHGLDSAKPVLDAKALAEASRNLTHTLRQLSSAALTTRVDEPDDGHLVRRRQGAIIESMHHHGRGVYSGTFSGTLNPALQDKHGRPKRDISTIIHILNDLLGATPQYRRHAHRTTASTSTNINVLDTGSITAQNKLITEKSQGDLFTKRKKEFHQLALENRATRGKMEQLQLMMEERRARRRARREARAPYTWSANSKTTSVKSETETGASRESSASALAESTDSNSATDFHPIPATETMVV